MQAAQSQSKNNVVQVDFATAPMIVSLCCHFYLKLHEILMLSNKTLHISFFSGVLLYLSCSMMVDCRRQLVPLLLLWLLLMLTFNVSHCHGSRATATNNVFKIEPKSPYVGHFVGFLPRHLPIPSSGPSRKHNDIGLQSRRSP
ncbi:hypothetical protein V6N11_023382 [Hibiscus sabdariffa]|uniref:Uncharacterized protein n=1 Tax=Hibiscus sabdariffa TaxID=183260 RepID=A0ABR2TM19_9ROSI